MDKRSNYSLDWYISSIQSAMRRFQWNLSPQTNTVPIDEAVDVLLDEFASEYEKALLSRHTMRNRFRAHLYQHWGHAIEMLEFYILLSERAGILFSEMYEIDYEDGDYRFDALVKLHARACRVSREVLTLLREGYATGAMARWRAIYEMAAAAIFLSESSQTTAKRFHDYRVVKDYYEAMEYRDHQDELGLEPIDEDEWETIQNDFENMLNEHGERFKDFWGGCLQRSATTLSGQN